MRRLGLILGIGNQSRGDDAAGIEVARRLKANACLAWDIMETDGEPTKLLDTWWRYQTVIAIDAVLTGKAPPGSIFCWDVSSNPLPAECRNASSHSLGLAEAIELARVFGKLPADIKVIGIEGYNYCFAASLSTEVEKAVQELVLRMTKFAKGDDSCMNFLS